MKAVSVSSASSKGRPFSVELQQSGFSGLVMFETSCAAIYEA